MTEVTDRVHSNLIDLWLDSNIINKAHDIELPYLLKEIQYLSEILPGSFTSEFNLELDQLSSWLKKYELQLSKYQEHVHHGNREEFKKSLSNNISDREVIAFLANKGTSEKINFIRSVYFFISLRLVTLTDHHSRIKKTLDECRFLTNKTRRFLVQFLPDVATMQSLNELFDWLTINKNNDHYSNWSGQHKDDKELVLKKYFKAYDNLDDDSIRQTLINEKISEYLYEYILPIEYVLKESSGITRKRNSENTYLTIEANKLVDEITGNTVSDITFISENISDASAFEAQERQDDEEQSHQAVSFNEPQNYYLDIVRAEQQVNCRHQRSLSQMTDVNKAHPSDIKVLLKFLIDQLSNLKIKNNSDNECVIVNDLVETNRQEYQSYIYLFLLLLTGNNQTWMSDEIKQNHLTWTCRVEFKPTRSQIDENWDTTLCSDNQEYLFLYLPKKIGQLYDCLLKEDTKNSVKVIEKRAGDILNELNKEHRTKLTIQRLTGYLSHCLNQEGHDQAIIDILTNQPISHLSALPYFNVSQIDLYMCQLQFSEHLKELIDCRNTPFLEIIDDKFINYWGKKIGTALAVKDEEIKKVVLKLKSELFDLLKLDSLKDIYDLVDKHNVFTDYLYLMLSISSGYRPVREPFGRLKHLDTRTGKYFISDKENHKTTRGRFIYLPKIAREQVQAYIDYLNRLAKLLTRFDISVADIYKGILDSKSGIITYLSYDDQNDSVSEVELTKSYVLERQQNLINLPLNWYRHYIRSYKSNTESGMYSLSKYSFTEHFGYDVISAWMGHADALGYDFFDRYSGLSSSELKQLSEKLNDILIDLGFETIVLRKVK